MTNTVYTFNDITYPSDKKRYYIFYADILIALGSYSKYILNNLIALNFHGVKLEEFHKYMLESIIFTSHIGSEAFSNTKLALYIKNFQEEIAFKRIANSKTVIREKPLISVANLSNFLFCPVSLAIKLTFDQYTNESWEKDEWKNEKLLLADRYKILKQTMI